MNVSISDNLPNPPKYFFTDGKEMDPKEVDYLSKLGEPEAKELKEKVRQAELKDQERLKKAKADEKSRET